MPNWKIDVRLMFRVYGRQMENSELAFQEIKDDIVMRYHVRANFGEVKETLWPVRPEQVEECERKGYFVLKEGVSRSLVVREMPIIIVCDGFEHAEAEIGKILADFPGKFASVEIVKTFLTDIFAV